jgi:hypothetical protein
MAIVVKTPFTLFESFETNDKGVIRRRFLKYDLNALADFEQMMGMGFAQLMQMKAIFAACRALLWAGLKHEDRTLTLERVGDLLSRYLREAGGSIDEALSTAFSAALDQGAMGRPEPEVDDAGNPQPAPSEPVKAASPVSQALVTTPASTE